MDYYKLVIPVSIIILIVWLSGRYTSRVQKLAHKVDKLASKNVKLKKKLSMQQKEVLKLPHLINSINAPTPEPNKQEEPEYDRVIRYIRINSSDRDTARFPSAASFQTRFEQTIHNIESVELSKFAMSKSMYTVDDHNSKMIIRDVTQDTKTVFDIPHGFYSIGSYVTKINEMLAASDMDLRLYFNSLSHKVTIKNEGVDTTYKIIYSTEEFEYTNFNCIGFDAKDFTLGPTEEIEGNRRVDLFGANAISLGLKEVSYGYGDDILANVLVKENVITTYENDGDRPRRKLSPLLTLDRITISTTFQEPFKTRRLYEYNGIEFSMVLEIVTLERKLPFKQILTART